MKCGGLSNAREIAQIGEQAGIPIMWGCMVESVISISAALHTALSCQNTKYLDLDGSFDLLDDIAEGGFVLKGGCLSVTDDPGLGVILKDNSD
jgi:L-alanine-DL-glutamate epimerase-like enolase superfamily enzyme